MLNKNDLEKKLDIDASWENVIYTNTTSSDGIETLKDKIKQLFNFEKINTKDATYLSNTRQISLAKRAYKSLLDAEASLSQGLPIDMIEIDLKNSFDLLGEIIGVSYSDEIIDSLFENFCVGK